MESIFIDQAAQTSLRTRKSPACRPDPNSRSRDRDSSSRSPGRPNREALGISRIPIPARPSRKSEGPSPFPGQIGNLNRGNAAGGGNWGLPGLVVILHRPVLGSLRRKAPEGRSESAFEGLGLKATSSPGSCLLSPHPHWQGLPDFPICGQSGNLNGGLGFPDSSSRFRPTRSRESGIPSPFPDQIGNPSPSRGNLNGNWSLRFPAGPGPGSDQATHNGTRPD